VLPGGQGGQAPVSRVWVQFHPVCGRFCTHTPSVARRA
jgi:hypothetical protein